MSDYPKPSYGSQVGKGILGRIKHRKRLGLILLGMYSADVLMPGFGGWYSVPTEHVAVVTGWSGKRYITEQVSHLKPIWYVPVFNWMLTNIDTHFKGENIWYLRQGEEVSFDSSRFEPSKNVDDCGDKF